MTAHTGVPTSVDQARPSGRRREALLIIGFVLAATGAMEAWRWHLDAAWAPQLRAVARHGDIRMWSSVTCTYCTRARDWLTRSGVPFDECFIERDAVCAAQYQQHGAPGTPLLRVRGQPQLGFDPQRVLRALQGPAAS